MKWNVNSSGGGSVFQRQLAIGRDYEPDSLISGEVLRVIRGMSNGERRGWAREGINDSIGDKHDRLLPTCHLARS